MSGRLVLAAAFLSAAVLVGPVRSEPDGRVIVGVLPFGTAQWEVDVIKRGQLDRAHGFILESRPLATPEAAKIALLGGAVDAIVADWLWVARQRAEGERLVFIPFSRATGTLMLRQGSSVAGLQGLRGLRIGIAGGPLDKNWLLLRALSKQRLGFDLADEVVAVFGAPPLLDAELNAGRIDAALTYWQYAAAAEARGGRPLIAIADILRELGLGDEVPMLGFVMREEWALSNRETILGFSDASRRAKGRLAACDEGWADLVRPLTRGNARMSELLCEAYRVSVPTRWGDAERQRAGRLFQLLRQSGGTDLLGRAEVFDAGVFWPDVVY
jgi:NitT/TauT family transport system substrate-binding protein